MKREIVVSGKEVDVNSIGISNLSGKEIPVMSDVFVYDAKFVDGTRLSEKMIEELQDQYPDFIYEKAVQLVF